MEIEERRAWLGDWDPEEFDLEAVKEEFDKGRGVDASLDIVRERADGSLVEIGPEDVDDFDEVILRIDMAAEARGATEFWQSPIPCFARTGRPRCSGRLQIRQSADLTVVAWRCSECGDKGELRWRGDADARAEPREPVPGDDLTAIRMSCDEYEVLMMQFSLPGEIADAVSAAGWDGTDVVIEVAEDMLEDLIEGVAAEANHASGKRRKFLDKLGDRIEKALD